MIKFSEIKDLITYNWRADFISFYSYYGDYLRNMDKNRVWGEYLKQRHRLN